MKSISTLKIILLKVIFIFGNGFSQPSITTNDQINTNPLPFSIPDANIIPLRKLVDKDLQRKLVKRINQNKKWSRLILWDKLSVGLVDLSNPQNARFSQINGDVMMYAASLPKLAILLAAAQSLEDGTLEETPEVLKDMRMMISQSDNPAATRMIDRLGFEKISDVLTDPRYELYDPKLGGGLWVGKRYAKYSKRYPDPYMGISHGATVTQICRFYYLLSMGKLVNRERSVQMLDILEDPEIHHKFVKSLEKIVPDARLFRKSGTWRKWHSDSVLVWGPVWRRYIVAALVEDDQGEQILRDLIPAIEEVLKSDTVITTTKKNN